MELDSHSQGKARDTIFHFIGNNVSEVVITVAETFSADSAARAQTFRARSLFLDIVAASELRQNKALRSSDWEQSSRAGWTYTGSNSLRVLGKQFNCEPRAKVTNEHPPQPSGACLPSTTNYWVSLANMFK